MSKGGKSIQMPARAPQPAPGADAWVTGRAGEEATGRESATVTPFKAPQPEKEKMARFTFDVPESLHRRMKVACAGRGVRMTDVIRELLEREFPAVKP